jgi:D-alanine-D-alanine ligase
VGSLSGTSRLAWLKPIAKTLIQRSGLSTPDSLTLAQETFRELGASGVLATILNTIHLPLVVKPAQGGSAQGVSIVTEEGDLTRAMVEAFTYSDVALIEKQIIGTEVAVSIIDRGDGPEVLPIVEIEPVHGGYSFEARYNAGETCFYTPARLEKSTMKDVAETALKVYEILGLRHISRIDFIVDSEQTPWFLEANVLPGLTETSLVPQAITAAGLQFGSVYSDLAITAIRDSQPAH